MPIRSGTAWVSLALLIVAPCLLARAAQAQIGSSRYSSIVIEAASGNVLSAVNADELRHPASLTKMMTLYLAFEALRDRRIGLYQPVPVSAHAASMSPSKLGLMPGTRLTVEEAILGLVTKSANDAAAALGELLGGDEERFAQMMTLRARALGMTRTVFRNASGLPDPAQVTTARDLATLGRHLIRDFPLEYRYFSTPTFTWRGRTIFNHDRLLQTYPGADGIKTGYIDASGHNLVTSAVRGDVRLVGVVLGAASNPERDIHMSNLLDQGFERMDVPVAPRIAAPSHLPALVPVANAAPLARPRPQLARWSVQVGAFGTLAAARQAAANARRAADDGDIRVEQASVRGRKTWRAQLTGLSQSEAAQACATLARHRIPCTPLRPEGGQMASR
ncbi:D-alanyl-D-alanine carboxypeptidase family protein [Rhodovastum atsumiense]|nr:D-alanyl-D-alanine carboxypeptidase family protein [Rhodovastum atsumiense]